MSKELRTLIKLDRLFRRRLADGGNTLAVIQQALRDANEGYPTSRDSISRYVRKLEDEWGAVFKKEKGYGYNKQIEGNYRGRVNARIYEYEDPYCVLDGLEAMIGKEREDTGKKLLDLINQSHSTDSVHIWAKLFVEKMINEKNIALDAVSFYENLDLQGHQEFFETLLKYILDKQPVKLECSFDKRPTVYFQPYMLKNYNQRWYVIGKRLNDEPREEHPEEYYEGYSPIPFNKIVSVEKWDAKYIEPDLDEIRDYFDEVIGMTFNPKNEPEEVYLRFEPARYEDYVKTKPIHLTQTEVGPDSPYYCPERPTVRIEVRRNRELTQQILSFGPDCEVVAPESLRQEVAQKVAEMMNLYPSN